MEDVTLGTACQVRSTPAGDAAVLQTGSDSSSSAGLWLGDESWAKDPAIMASMSITHRLQCNMREDDARRWMSEQWCDCPMCPARVSLGDSDLLTTSEPALIGDVPRPPPAPHPVPRPPALKLSVRERVEVDGTDIVDAYLPLFDDEPFAQEHAAPLLRAGARFIHEALDVQGGRVYVHCEKGCSRSPSVVAQYLVEFRGFGLVEAAEFLKAQRCRVSPNGGFVDALVKNAQELREGSAASVICHADDGTGKVGMANAAVESTRSVSAAVIGAFRRPWLSDFRAGRVRPQPVDRIL